MPSTGPCGLVVVPTDNGSRRLGEVGSERCAVSGRRQSYVGVDREGGQLLACRRGRPDQGGDLPYRPGRDRDQVSGRELFSAFRIRRQHTENGWGNDVAARGRAEYPLGQAATWP